MALIINNKHIFKKDIDYGWTLYHLETCVSSILTYNIVFQESFANNFVAVFQ